MSSTATAVAADRHATFDRMSIGLLVPSKTNPRTHFDEAYIDELAASIREKGLIQPLIVRPHPHRVDNRYEIVAGECRYRACQRAGLEIVPAILRDYTDEQVLEVQLEENIHRTDLTPLEEAVGFKRLIDSNRSKHSVESIATRLGKSPTWVWDRLKLNDLIPEAKALLEAGRFTVGHAIPLSRLKVEDQARAIDSSTADRFGVRGLWQTDDGRLDLDEATGKRDPYDGLKPVSIREFETWIRNHVRFDIKHAAQAQPLVYEETAAVVESAAAQPGRGKKVVSITREFRVADDARDEHERTYGAGAWVRADGNDKSKTCEHSVLGVFVAGDDYGKTLQVCVARDRCRVHFKKVIEEREANQKLREQGKATTAATRERQQREKAEQERQAREAQQRAERAAWVKARPALTAAVVAGVKRCKVATLAAFVFDGQDTKAAVRVLGAPKTADDHLRVWTLASLLRCVDDEHWGPSHLRERAKRLGIDIAPALKAAAADQAKPASKMAAPAKQGKK